MAGWPKRFSSSELLKRSNLPALWAPSLPSTAVQGEVTKNKLPRASMVYGGAASLFLVIAIFTLLKGSWLDAFLILLLAACFLGFAVHFIRNN